MLPWQAEQQIFTPTRIAVHTPSSPASFPLSFSLSPRLYSPICFPLFVSLPSPPSFILPSVLVPQLSFPPAQSFPKETWLPVWEAMRRGRSVACTDAPFRLLRHSLHWSHSGLLKEPNPSLLALSFPLSCSSLMLRPASPYVGSTSEFYMHA